MNNTSAKHETSSSIPAHILEKRLRRRAVRLGLDFKKYEARSEFNPRSGKYRLSKGRNGAIVGSSDAITLQEAAGLLGVPITSASSSCPDPAEHADRSSNCTVDESLGGNESLLQEPNPGSDKACPKDPLASPKIEPDGMARSCDGFDLRPLAVTWAAYFVDATFPDEDGKFKFGLLSAVEAAFLAALDLSERGIGNWKEIFKERATLCNRTFHACLSGNGPESSNIQLAQVHLALCKSLERLNKKLDSAGLKRV